VKKQVDNFSLVCTTVFIFPRLIIVYDFTEESGSKTKQRESSCYMFHLVSDQNPSPFSYYPLLQFKTDLQIHTANKHHGEYLRHC